MSCPQTSHLGRLFAACCGVIIVVWEHDQDGQLSLMSVRRCG